jgi:hypothetical protein
MLLATRDAAQREATMNRSPLVLVLTVCIAMLACSGEEESSGASGAPGDAAPDSVDASTDASLDTSWPETGSPDGTAPADADADVPAQDVTPEASLPLTAQQVCDIANPNRLESVRNGSEICDDQAFAVPDPYVPLVIACFAGSDGNGVAYVASNTGPECVQAEGCCESQVDCPAQDRLANEGNSRCQGFELCGCAGQLCPCANAWDSLQYVSDGAGEIRIDCPPEGVIRDLDLSGLAGQTLWVGSHTQPDFSGRMTETCVAIKP